MMDPVEADFLQAPLPRPSSSTAGTYTADSRRRPQYQMDTASVSQHSTDTHIDVPVPRLPSRDSDDGRRDTEGLKWSFEPQLMDDSFLVQGSTQSAESFGSGSSPGVGPLAPSGLEPTQITSLNHIQLQGGDVRGGGPGTMASGLPNNPRHQRQPSDRHGEAVPPGAEDMEEDAEPSSGKSAADSKHSAHKSAVLRCLIGPITRCPCCVALISFIVCIAIVAVGLISKFPEVGTDFDEFMKTDVDASRLYDGLLAALDYRDPSGSSSADRRRLSSVLNISLVESTSIDSAWREVGLIPGQFPRDLAANTSRRMTFFAEEIPLYKQFDLQVAYELNSKSSYDNIFDTFIINEIAAFESRLRGTPSWSKFCTNDALPDGQQGAYYGLCTPGLSFANYVLPKREIMTDGVIPTKFTWDGRGEDQLPLEIVFGMTEQHNLSRIMLPQDFVEETSATLSPSELASQTRNFGKIRSAFRFKTFCCTTLDPPASQRAVVNRLKEDWEKFMEDELLPILQEPVPSSWEDVHGKEEDEYPFHVWYTGDSIESLEVIQTLMRDLLFAIGSMTFVFLYMVFHTKSIFLSCCGLLTIFLSVPVAYVTFAFIADTETMSIASFLSVFLVIGLGADVVFVYTDFWRDSASVHKTEAARMRWTYQHAAKASFATTATTAISFLANLASVLRSLREFGTFMGLCVMFVWVIVSLIYVPLCAVDERWLKCCRFRCCCPKVWEACAGAMPISRLGTGDGKEENFKNRMWRRWVNLMTPWRRTIVFFSAAIGLLMLGVAVASAEADTSGFPNIFPRDHNQNRGQKTLEKFLPLSEVFPDNEFFAPPINTTVCDEHAVFATSRCSLFWCEVQPTITVADSTCRCWRKETIGSCDATAIAVQRVVGLESLTSTQAAQVFAPSLFDGQTPGLTPLASSSAVSNAPIVLEVWEDGTVAVDPIIDITTRVQRGFASPCRVEDICYCDAPICRVPEGNAWTEINPIPYPASGLNRRMYLQAEQLRWRADQRPLINVVIGIAVTEGTPLLGAREPEEEWSFVSSYEAARPQAQRTMRELCTALPEDLRAVPPPTAKCWIEEFREWVLTDPLGLLQGGRFPVPANLFNEHITAFQELLSLTTGTPHKEYLWLRPDGDGNNMVMASIFKFEVDIDEDIEVDAGLDYMELWDSYLNDFTSRVPERDNGRAFHASELWVRLEAQRELVQSTIVTIIIVLGLAFLGMLLFTCNIILSALVVVCTLQVIFGLAFFITVMMKWPIGAVEVIALIVFIGYAVTYSLHVAHKFGGVGAIEAFPLREDVHRFVGIRYNRTLFSLQMIGTAAIGSAATTFGCSMFLLFCDLTIFNKLGGVVMAVTVMSIITALGTLPAVLLVIGPTHKGCIGVHCNSRDVSEAKQRVSMGASMVAEHVSTARSTAGSYVRSSISAKSCSDRQTLWEDPETGGGDAPPPHRRSQDSSRAADRNGLTGVAPSGGSSGHRGGTAYDRYARNGDDPALPVPSDRMSGFDIGTEAPIEPIQVHQVTFPNSRTPSRSPRAANGWNPTPVINTAAHVSRTPGARLPLPQL